MVLMVTGFRVASVVPKGECELQRAFTVGINLCETDLDFKHMLGRYDRKAIRKVFIVARDTNNGNKVWQTMVVQKFKISGVVLNLVCVDLRKALLRGHLNSYIRSWCGVHISSLKSLSRRELGPFCRLSQGLPLCWVGGINASTARLESFSSAAASVVTVGYSSQ